MCDCRKDIEAKLLERFRVEAPEATDHSVELLGYGWIFPSGAVSQATRYERRASFPLKKGGTKAKTIGGNFVFNFCPFCGVKIRGRAAA